MIVGGFCLVLWIFTLLPGGTTVIPSGTGSDAAVSQAVPRDLDVAGGVDSGASSASPEHRENTSGVATQPLQPAPDPAIVELGEGLPAEVVDAILAVAVEPGQAFTVAADVALPDLRLDLDGQEGGPVVYRQYFAAATRFDTIDPAISLAEIRDAWSGESTTTAGYASVAVLTSTLPALAQILGPAGPTVTGHETITQVTDAAWDQTPTLALVPFHQLIPRLAVLAVDGANPVENAQRFDPTAYPLVANVYLHNLAAGATGEALSTALAAAMGANNRDPNRLTVIAMTGVTAMVRKTAEQMDLHGPEWPAEVVGPELASADITAISNEVPFVPGCETNTDLNNLVFCSKPEYMAALTRSGADIIGLTGNHLNDFGLEASLQSLAIYAKAGLPVYGGGKNQEAAIAPLYIEHNGNRLAFLGANSFGPRFAWATDSRPGSAEFDINIMSATIRSIKQKDLADLVLAELQYQESYGVEPLFDQRQTFRALVRAGADIVTGVQSHVPQAMEFEDGNLILYGLGNLYFDQMWQMSTREGMIVKHTIYEGRHISTQTLTTLLYDFGQPRWTTPQERASILNRVFAVSYW
jgi:hypothetical protein